MSITNFYEGQEILITGGSGFVGKALIEKIIRSFPNFGKIYVLIRGKNNKSADDRLTEVLNSSLFKRARQEQPQAFSKVFSISGDCKELGLSLPQEDLQKIKNVTMIFHSAASVRFDDYFKNAILLNTRGTHELIKIAETLPKLKAFIHISTTYCNPDVHEVEEEIYPAIADWRTTIRLAENFDTELLNTLFPKYSENQPNTYTFTKSLAEQIINDYRHKLPVLVYRPSIVVCSIDEPIAGWADNFNGPLGMLVACGVGILRTNHANPDLISDFIPVDVAVKGLLIAGYKLANENAAYHSKELEVINCASSNINPIKLGEVISIGKGLIKENPFEKCLWLPEGSITRCAVWHYLRFVTLQICPAILIDGLLRLFKRKPLLLKLQRRIYAANIALYVFITTEWLFNNDNFRNLEKLIPAEEQEKLGFMKYSCYDHYDFLRNGVRGAKEFLLHEQPEASKQAKIRVKIFEILHYFFQISGVLLLFVYTLKYLYNFI